MNSTTLNMTTLDGGNVIIKRGEGGGTTINNQDKVVDITENGTTEVVADGGFTGLGKVTINTEVSGGGSGESGSGDEWVYLDISTNSPSRIALENLFGLGKSQMGEQKAILPLNIVSEDATAIAFIPNLEMYFNADGTELKTVLEFVNFVDSSFKIDNYPRITKEQFYSLD